VLEQILVRAKEEKKSILYLFQSMLFSSKRCWDDLVNDTDIC